MTNIKVMLGQEKLILCLANNWQNGHARCVLFMQKVFMRALFFRLKRVDAGPFFFFVAL